MAIKDTTTLKWIASGMLLIVSFAGVGFPYIAMRANERLLETTWFQLTRVLCTGLVCSVAMLHVLADANEYLSKVSDFPWADALALVGILLMVAIKELGILSMRHLRQHATSKHPSNGQLEEGLLGDAADKDAAISHASHNHCDHGHVHNHPCIEFQHIDFTGKPLQRFTVYMMEASIMIHSVLVGLALGVLSGSVAVLSLGTALLFHQFFEGLALGAVAVKSGFSLKSSWHLVLTFALSCPLGAVLGIFVSTHYDPKDYWTACTLGALNAIAAGTLLHIGLVELLPEDFGEEDCHHRDVNAPHPLARLLALFLGGAIMAVLAIWA
mmetsp:Transcript_29205/g.73297  ORF Transcript_29205/g.73297 Transcript_29205/m.73297 type:complete len:326 (-) Transcript_29205:127-1104(-)